MKIHEYLETVVIEGKGEHIRCTECGFVFCKKRDNYKKYAVLLKEKLEHINCRFLHSQEPANVVYYQFCCPGCGTMLEVDAVCPDLNSSDPVLWDLQIF